MRKSARAVQEGQEERHGRPAVGAEWVVVVKGEAQEWRPGRQWLAERAHADGGAVCGQPAGACRPCVGQVQEAWWVGVGQSVEI
jgi:hypothetical protein